MSRVLRLVVETLGHRGVGIGRHQGKVVMVPLSAPGDELEVEIIESHKSYEEGRILKLLNPSPWRREPPCKYFGSCGGCQLQHLEISYQRRQKEKIFSEMMEFGSRVAREKVGEILFGQEEFGYRCRLDLRVVWDRWPRVGFSRRGSEELIPVESCMVARKRINDVLETLEGFLKEFLPWRVSRVEIACDDSSSGFTLFLARRGRDIPPRERKFAEAAGELKGLRSISMGRTEGGRVETLWALDGGPLGVWMTVNLPDHREMVLEVWPGVFSQVNPEVNEILVNLIFSWAHKLEARRILDLYAGMGNLSIPLSTLASRVVAVEVDPRAVENGLENSRRVGAENIIWIRNSAAKAISDLVSKGEKFDLVVLDPPRAGAKEIMGAISLLDPKGVIYVSCDPATLARDIAILQRESPLRVQEIVPLDMFPQTYHIESASLLLKPEGAR